MLSLGLGDSPPACLDRLAGFQELTLRGHEVLVCCALLTRESKDGLACLGLTRIQGFELFVDRAPLGPHQFLLLLHTCEFLIQPGGLKTELQQLFLGSMLLRLERLELRLGTPGDARIPRNLGTQAVQIRRRRRHTRP